MVAGDELVRDDALLDDVMVGLDDEPAVEGRDRRRERERLDEHRHPARRPAARHREVDAGVVERVHGRDRARRVSVFPLVTSVPSTSESTSRITSCAR